MDYKDISLFSWHGRPRKKETTLFRAQSALNTVEMNKMRASFFLSHLCRCHIFCKHIASLLSFSKNNFYELLQRLGTKAGGNHYSM